MESIETHTENQDAVVSVLEKWAEATRQDRKDDVLNNHAENVVIFDVLGPMKYQGRAEYRTSWGEWQPESMPEMVFALKDLRITAGSDVGFAYGFIHCAGTTPDGHDFEDLVRATFCLEQHDGRWLVTHQHISKPME